jgi:hypothetical protein
LQPRVKALGVIDAHNTAENEIGDDGQTDCNEYPNIKPQFVMPHYFVGEGRIGEKEPRHNQHNDSIPEKFDFLEIYKIILLLQIFDLQHPKFIVQENKHRNGNKRESNHEHVLIPVFENTTIRTHWFHKLRDF